MVEIRACPLSPTASLGPVFCQAEETSCLCFRVRWLRGGEPERLTAVVHRRAESPRPSPSVHTRGLRCVGRLPSGRTQAPDSGGAQAGGVSPPFTVCAHSWLEVCGERGAAGESGAGGGRGMSDRCGALDVALRAWALSCRGLGAGADCGLLWRLLCCLLLLYDCGLGRD